MAHKDVSRHAEPRVTISEVCQVLGITRRDYYRKQSRSLDPVLTVADVCRALGISRRTFYRKRSTLPLVELRGLPGRYSGLRLQRYLESGR